MLPFSHFLIGLIIAIPFVEKREKLYFFIIAVVGANFPDIDLFIPYLDHRSITHSIWFWLVVTGILLLVLIIFNNDLLGEIVLLFQITWLSHLIFDFGYTQYWFFDLATVNYTTGWFFDLSMDTLIVIDNYIAIPLTIAILFYYLIIRQLPIASS